MSKARRYSLDLWPLKSAQVYEIKSSEGSNLAEESSERIKESMDQQAEEGGSLSSFLPSFLPTFFLSFFLLLDEKNLIESPFILHVLPYVLLHSLYRPL